MENGHHHHHHHYHYSPLRYIFFNFQAIQWKETDIMELSWGCRKKLASLLAPESTNDWRMLADKLGFKYLDIQNFANAKGSNSVMDMLDAYNGFKEASIPALYNALYGINRHDACLVFETYQKVGVCFIN